MSLIEVLVMFCSFLGCLVIYIVASAKCRHYIDEYPYFFGVGAVIAYLALFILFLPLTIETKRLLHNGTIYFHGGTPFVGQSRIIVANANLWDFVYLGAAGALSVYFFFAWLGIAQKYGSSYDGEFNDPTTYFFTFGEVFKIIGVLGLLAVIAHFIF